MYFGYYVPRGSTRFLNLILVYIIYANIFDLEMQICFYRACGVLIEIVGVVLLSEVMFGRAMNRTTTNRCLIELDHYLLGVCVLLPELLYAIAFSSYYGREFSPTAILLSRGTL